MYEEYINQLHIEAKLRNLADSSIKTYTDFILRFLEYTGKDPQDISAEDVRKSKSRIRRFIIIPAVTDVVLCVRLYLKKSG